MASAIVQQYPRAVRDKVKDPTFRDGVHVRAVGGVNSRDQLLGKATCWYVPVRTSTTTAKLKEEEDHSLVVVPHTLHTKTP